MVRVLHGRLQRFATLQHLDRLFLKIAASAKEVYSISKPTHLADVDSTLLRLSQEDQQHIETFFLHNGDDEKNLAQNTAAAAR